MKLLKFIFKLVLFIVLLVLIAVCIILWIGYDSSKTTFVPKEEKVSMETIIGDSLYDSFDRISKIDNEERNTSDNNYIGILLKEEDMNNIVVDFVRTNDLTNKDYLKDEDNDYIIKKAGLKLNSITFEEDENRIAAVARIEAYGFYHTSVKISGEPYMDGKVLKIKFENFRLGKTIKINKKRVLSLFKTFNIKFNSNSMFDPNTLTLSLDLTKQIENISSSSKLLAFFSDCDYSVNYNSEIDALSLNLDTKKIFTKVYDIDVESPLTFNTDLVSDPLDPKVTLSEGQFNFLIKNNFSEVVNNFNQDLEIGGKTFNFKLESMYYNVDTNEILANVKINDLQTNLVATIEIEKEKDSDEYLENLRLKVVALKLGDTTVAADFIDDVLVPSSILTPDSTLLKVEDVIFNEELENVVIDYAYAA